MAVLLFSLAFLGYLYFIGWIWRGCGQVQQQQPSPGEVTPLKFSVIIAAHNEAENLPRLLEALHRQNYPREDVEVIVAADRCEDDTEAVANSFKDRFPNLRIISIHAIPPGVSPKKHVIQTAIHQAAYEYLLFLDADVVPTENHLRTYCQYFNSGAAAVVSLMKFYPPQSRFQKFLVYEKLVSWCIAGAGIGHRRPIMAYGGNWGYTRSAFEAVGGFEGILHSLSGDDDLLVQKMGNQRLPVAFCLDEGGWIRTAAPATFRQFLRQRRRHFSAGKKYRPAVQIAYFCYHLLNLFLWTGWLFYLPGLGFLAAKLLADTLLLRRGMKMFDEHFNPGEMVIFNGLYMLYTTVVGPLGHVGRVRW